MGEGNENGCIEKEKEGNAATNTDGNGKEVLGKADGVGSDASEGGIYAGRFYPLTQHCGALEVIGGSFGRVFVDIDT